MIDFAMTRSMVVSSTLFQHKRINLQTWKSPDGVALNQTDHVMIDSHHATDTVDVKTRK